MGLDEDGQIGDEVWGTVVVKRIHDQAKVPNGAHANALTHTMDPGSIREGFYTTIVVTQAITLEVFGATQQTRILEDECHP